MAYCRICNQSCVSPHVHHGASMSCTLAPHPIHPHTRFSVPSYDARQTGTLRLDSLPLGSAVAPHSYPWQRCKASLSLSADRKADLFVAHAHAPHPGLSLQSNA